MGMTLSGHWSRLWRHPGGLTGTSFTFLQLNFCSLRLLRLSHGDFFTFRRLLDFNTLLFYFEAFFSIFLELLFHWTLHFTLTLILDTLTTEIHVHFSRHSDVFGSKSLIGMITLSQSSKGWTYHGYHHHQQQLFPWQQKQDEEEIYLNRNLHIRSQQSPPHHPKGRQEGRQESLTVPTSTVQDDLQKHNPFVWHTHNNCKERKEEKKMN